MKTIKNNKPSTNKKTEKYVLVLFCLFIAGCVLVLGINFYVKETQKSSIVSLKDAAAKENVDFIIVLGCQVKDDGSPSDMLKDRLDKAIELYNISANSKLLMSGDHGRVDYNEVGTMGKYSTDKGVPPEDIVLDHAGFSTYESVYRAKEVFNAEKVVIITQKYHLYRALYVAEELGIEAYGVSCDHCIYSGQFMRECREILARFKDFILTAI